MKTSENSFAESGSSPGRRRLRDIPADKPNVGDDAARGTPLIRYSKDNLIVPRTNGRGAR